MSETIVAVVTNDARKYWPMFFGMKIPKVPSYSGPIDPGTSTDGDTWNPLITYFRLGEGGWVISGGSEVPRTPDPDLRKATPLTGFDGASYLVQDLDCICDPTRSPMNQRYPGSLLNYEKALLPADVDYGSYGDTTIRITCHLDGTEFNGANIGEVGIFCAHPRVPDIASTPATRLMLAYGTFPRVMKNSGEVFTRYVYITF